MKELRKNIILIACILSLITEIISIIIIGFSVTFSIGLLIGLIVAIINFIILMVSTEMVLEKKKPYIAPISMIIRFALYGGSFIYAIKDSYTMGIGTGIGLLTIQIAIFILYAIIPSFKRLKNV